MSATAFAQLLQLTFEENAASVFEKPAAEVYADLEQAEAAVKKDRKAPAALHDALAFRFERVRLGVAVALIKVFTRLSDNPESHQVLDVLRHAITASSPAEIDEIIQSQVDVFENLYMEMFNHEQRDQVLGLFEETLQAGSVKDLNQIIREAMKLIGTISFPEPDEDQDDELQVN